MKILLAFITALFLFFCTHCSESENDNQAPVTAVKKELPPGSEQITAKFIEASFGDMAHIQFKDKDGKDYSFASNKSKTKFLVELPEAEANADNQGFGSNKKLIGKMFQIVFKKEKQFVEGAGQELETNIILDAKPID